MAADTLPPQCNTHEEKQTPDVFSIVVWRKGSYLTESHALPQGYSSGRLASFPTACAAAMMRVSTRHRCLTSCSKQCHRPRRHVAMAAAAAVERMSVSDKMASLKAEGKTALVPYICAGAASTPSYNCFCMFTAM